MLIDFPVRQDSLFLQLREEEWPTPEAQLSIAQFKVHRFEICFLVKFAGLLTNREDRTNPTKNPPNPSLSDLFGSNLRFARNPANSRGVFALLPIVLKARVDKSGSRRCSFYISVLYCPSVFEGVNFGFWRFFRRCPWVMWISPCDSKDRSALEMASLERPERCISIE